MKRRQKILMHLRIDENTYNNLVLDTGYCYLGTQDPSRFWKAWWAAWDDGDKVELEIRDPNQTVRQYVLSQVLACKFLMTHDPQQATRSIVQVR
jgi:hypothetical protein